MFIISFYRDCTNNKSFLFFIYLNRFINNKKEKFYVIFPFPIIYMIILSGLAKITRLIKINSMGTSIKLALLLVFFQVCIKYTFVWKLAKEFGIGSKVF